MGKGRVHLSVSSDQGWASRKLVKEDDGAPQVYNAAV